MNSKLTMIFALSVLSLLLLTACSVETPPTKVTPTDKPKESPVDIELEATQELKKFSSVQEIREFLDKVQQEQGYSGYAARGFGAEMMVQEAVMDMAEGAPAPKAAVESAPVTAGDFSQTTVQVVGVDEADIVKNDNKYIYTIVQDNLVIVDAYPAEDADVVSKTELDGQPVNMFVNGNRLAVFTRDYDDVYMIPEYGYMPIPRRVQVTHVVIYDISDRSDPDEVEDFTVSGNYYQSRMIGDYVYFITQENVYYYNRYLDPPSIRAENRGLVRPDVYYFDNPETNYNFNTVASFNIEEPEKLNAKTFMMGYTNTLYVSQDNIYITYQKNLPWRYYQGHERERFFDVVVPLLPSSTQNEAEGIQDDESLSSHEQWDKISAVLEEMYNKMDEDDKEDLIEEIEDAIEEYEERIEIERRKTVIHKINIEDGQIDYDTRGEVPGYLLNQFSMDEYRENLRAATTTQLYLRGRGSEMFNNVYVLDKGLDIIGEIEGIAPDERIYSTRFIGDRLYMVTFKRIDPLFVIDLSDPKEPEILGKLKIPGYSDYLHPYDEDHIIGLGKETDTNEWGGTSVGGVKLALFDVSDVGHPKQIDKYEIGEPGSDSEALRDHKAFLFDREKNVLAIPVREVKGKQFRDGRYGYRQRVWQGVYVFGVSPEDGFDKKGKITHMEGDEDQKYWYHSPSAVRRSLYMDHVLYTVSATTIMMNNIDTVDDINEIELPFRERKYYDYPWWY